MPNFEDFIRYSTRVEPRRLWPTQGNGTRENPFVLSSDSESDDETIIIRLPNGSELGSKGYHFSQGTIN